MDLGNVEMKGFSGIKEFQCDHKSEAYPEFLVENSENYRKGLQLDENASCCFKNGIITSLLSQLKRQFLQILFQ